MLEQLGGPRAALPQRTAAEAQPPAGAVPTTAQGMAGGGAAGGGAAARAEEGSRWRPPRADGAMLREETTQRLSLCLSLSVKLKLTREPGLPPEPGATLGEETMRRLFDKGTAWAEAGAAWAEAGAAGQIVDLDVAAVAEVDVAAVAEVDVAGAPEADDDVVVVGEAVAYSPSEFEEEVVMGRRGFASADATAAGAAGEVEVEAAEGVEEVTLDVDVTRAEEVVVDGWGERVVAAVDLTALATEVALEALNQSPALDMAKVWLANLNRAEAQDKAKVEEWRRLRALGGEEELERRMRSESARRELADALTALIERR